MGERPTASRVPRDAGGLATDIASARRVPGGLPRWTRLLSFHSLVGLLLTPKVVAGRSRDPGGALAGQA